MEMSAMKAIFPSHFIYQFLSSYCRNYEGILPLIGNPYIVRADLRIIGVLEIEVVVSLS
jgi:hypothetical protein